MEDLLTLTSQLPTLPAAVAVLERQSNRSRPGRTAPWHVTVGTVPALRVASGGERTTADRLGRVPRWASSFHAAPEFEAEERECKLAAVEPLRLSRKHLLDGRLVPELRSGLTDTHSGNVDFRLADRFLAGGDLPGNGGRLPAGAVGRRRTSRSRAGSRHSTCCSQPELPRKGTRLNLAAYLLGAIDPLRWPNYRIRAVEDALDVLRPLRVTVRWPRATSACWPSTTRSSSAWRKDTTELDRLDAQSLMRAHRQVAERLLVIYTVEQWAELKEYRKVAARRKAALPPAKKAKVPSRPLRGHCTQCNNDETTFVGQEGDQWMFRCDERVQHVGGESYTFPQSVR